MDSIKLELPSNPVYLQMLRLTIASLSNRIGFDVEKVEDVKVIVSEIFTYLLPEHESIKVEFFLEKEKLTIDFDRIKQDEEGLNDSNFELKKQILLSLADELVLEDDRISVSINK